MNIDPKNGYKIDENMSISVQDICSGMPGGFFIYKAEGNEDIIYANNSMLRIFGCQTVEEFKELTKNSFKGIVHPEDYERISNSIKEQIEINPYNLDYVEYRIIRKDGKIRWVEDFGHYMNSEKYGGIFYVFIEDVTDRRMKYVSEFERINTELGTTQVRKNQLRKAVLNNAITFFEVNLTKNEFISAEKQSDGEGGADLFDFSKINAAAKYSDYAKYWTKHTDEKTLAEYRNFFNAQRLIECYKNGETEQVFESYAVDDQGRNRLFQYVIMLDENEFTGDIVALSVVKDITETSRRKKLFQTALSEANAETIAIQTFLKNFSRDIRTPINSIMSFSDMFSYNSDDPDMQEYCVERIKASSRQLFDNVNESMKNMKMDGNRSLGVTECDLSGMLGDMKQRMIADVTMKHINLVFDKDGINNFRVLADEVGLEEVIGQMLSNAVNYTSEGGTVTLKAYESAGSSEETGLYTFEISDDSIVVQGDFVDKMNELFDRKPDDVSINMNTEGWNLVVVKKFVDMMNGRIKAEALPGKGGRFTVTVELKHAK